jgi:hypothetical protein
MTLNGVWGAFVFSQSDLRRTDRPRSATLGRLQAWRSVAQGYPSPSPGVITWGVLGSANIRNASEYDARELLQIGRGSLDALVVAD